MYVKETKRTTKQRQNRPLKRWLDEYRRGTPKDHRDPRGTSKRSSCSRVRKQIAFSLGNDGV